MDVMVVQVVVVVMVVDVELDDAVRFHPDAVSPMWRANLDCQSGLTSSRVSKFRVQLAA